MKFQLLISRLDLEYKKATSRRRKIAVIARSFNKKCFDSGTPHIFLQKQLIESV